jgi:hypothetical protein
LYKKINEQYVPVQKNELYNPRGKYYYKTTELLNKINFNEYEYANTNLTSNNIYLERNFKLDVLEWLNNGKPKLFRSPTEGNYIVRLMHISLSPEYSLGRMIQAFSCTAY